MRNHNQSSSPGTFRTGTYLVIIAIIAVKTLRAVLNVLVGTYNTIADSRQARRA